MNSPMQAMENARRVIRKLRAGMHGPKVDDSTLDVSAYNQNGSLNGNDPNATPRTAADYLRAAEAARGMPEEFS